MLPEINVNGRHGSHKVLKIVISFSSNLCGFLYCSKSDFIWVRFLKQGEGFDISPGKSGVDKYNLINNYKFASFIYIKPGFI
jgi:hypothetical protein